MNGSEQSLLSHLDAPIVVGDPDGHAVYINPAFEDRFGESPLGVPLAELFEGGAREAVLRAVVTACSQDQTARFRLREGEVGFSGVASPITAAGQQVGVVILLKEEVEGTERLLAIQREMQGPMDDVGTALETLFEETGGRRNPHHRALVEDAQRAFTRVRKWTDEMQALIAGAPPPSAQAFDPAPALREIVRRTQRLSDAQQTSLELLIPATLPDLKGDEGRFVEVILRLVEARLDQSPAPERFTLSARSVGRGEDRCLLIGLSEHGPSARNEAFSDEPVLMEALASMGIECHAHVQADVGRISLLRLEV
jgi:hypothetical protein